MLSILTPTGERSEAFSACVDMMRAQTYRRPVKWVIVDDGREAMTLPEIEGWTICQVRPEPYWAPGMNTQARNIMAGLLHVEDRVVLIEDDDEYAPWWLEKCDNWLDHADLVGESHSLYRHRDTGRETEMGNDAHASLCSTAVKGPGREALYRACGSNKGIDMRLWRSFSGRKRLYAPNPRGVTGIKGWPGRPGIGVGHRLR